MKIPILKLHYLRFSRLTELLPQKFVLIGVGLFFSSLLGPAALAALSSDHSDYLLCKFKKEVRTVRVQDGNQGCKTTYTKYGIDKIVGKARDPRSCFSFMDNIRGNLESANWKCRGVSSASFSRSSGSAKVTSKR